MLYLDPPFQVINGYTILSDHADPRLSYLLPPAPDLALGSDGRPAFSLLQFQGGGTGADKIEGGLLTLTTRLRVPDEVLPDLRARLAQRAGAPARDVRLTPVLFDTGTVELIALGAASGAGETTAGPFSVHFLGSGKPSLGGENLATFQLVLDAPAAELVEAALDAPDLPIIVIYRLGFAGLRPSFRIDIQANWTKVYRSLQQRANVNAYIVAADAETMVTQALEESGMMIDTTVFGTDEGARGAAERARQQLVDWVLGRLFEPLADPSGATANAIGQVIDRTVWSLARAIVPGVGYRLRRLEENQLRMLSARLNESVAERREIVPQGTLGGLLHRFRVDDAGEPRAAWPSLRASLIQKVPLNGFPRLEVRVGTEDRFASDGLSEVRVDLARPLAGDALGNQQTLAFRSAAEQEEYIVNLLSEELANFASPYTYRVEIAFNPAGPYGPHEPVSSPWRDGRTTELVVEPRTVYAIRAVEVGVAPIFSFDQISVVTVEFRYTADGESSRQTGRVQLTADQPSRVWRFRSFAEQPQPYEYRITYHRPAELGGAITGPWQPQIDDWLAIPDPLPVKRRLDVFVNLPWPEVLVAFLQIRYRDDVNGIRIDDRIDLNPTTTLVQKAYGIAAGGSRSLTYRLTLWLQGQDLIEGSWRETADERLLIDRRLIERRVVTIRPIGGTLREARLAEVRVSLQVPDPVTGAARDETELRWTSDDAVPPFAPWEYLLGDPPAQTVRYRALFVDSNGFTTEIPWTTTTADLLVVLVKTRTITA